MGDGFLLLYKRLEDGSLTQDRTGSCRAYRGTDPVSDARIKPAGSKGQRGSPEKSTVIFGQNRDFFIAVIKSKISHCNTGFKSFPDARSAAGNDLKETF